MKYIRKTIIKTTNIMGRPLIKGYTLYSLKDNGRTFNILGEEYSNDLLPAAHYTVDTPDGYDAHMITAIANAMGSKALGYRALQVLSPNYPDITSCQQLVFRMECGHDMWVVKAMQSEKTSSPLIPWNTHPFEFYANED